MNINQILNLSPKRNIFWDTDINTIDIKKNADAIICRVFERGTFNDILNTLEYYGYDRFVNGLKHSQISNEYINLAYLMFDIKLNSNE